jgi:hypothetical protein
VIFNLTPTLSEGEGANLKYQISYKRIQLFIAGFAYKISRIKQTEFLSLSFGEGWGEV